MKLLRKQWFVTILLSPFLIPYTITELFPSLDNLYNIIRVIWCVAILVIYIYRWDFSFFVIMTTIYSLSMFLSITINHAVFEEVKGTIFTLISYVAISMIFEICIKESVENTLRAYISFYTVLSVLNLLFLLIYPEGIVAKFAPWAYHHEGCHFLGIRNHMIMNYLPYIAAVVIHSYFKKKGLSASAILMISTAVCSVFITWSATGVTALLIIVVYLLVIKNTIFCKLVSFKNVLILNIIIHYGIVILRLQYLFQPFIEEFLNRSIDFTGRTPLWERTYNYITQKPLFGWGEKTADLINIAHAHNTILDTLMRGGIIALFSWLLMVFACGDKLQRVKNHQFSSFLSIVLFALFTTYITEVYIGFSFSFIIFALAYHLPEIIRQYENKSGQEKIGIKNVSQFNYNLKAKIPKTLR